MNKFLSRIPFKILIYQQITEQSRKRSHASWIIPIYSDFSKNMMLKNSFYLCNNQFPWYAKVRENRLFRKRWLKLEYLISQTLFLSIRNFSSYWLRPHCEKSRKMFLSAIEINPFKMNQQPRRWNRIAKSKAVPWNKKFSKHTSGNGV